LTERQFFQRFVPDEPLHVVSSRFVPVEATREVVAAIESHQDKERILRAVGQYSVTLEQWSLGSELLAVAHLFMGAEALKTACWKHAVRQGSNSSEQLAQEWGFDGRPRLNEFLDREARVRLVFGGDKTCHRKAKEISDGFEHGYANPGSLFDPAREVLIATARHIRRAVFSILEITEDTRRVLENDRYNRPRGLPKLEAYLHGTLTNAANAEALAGAGNEHPIFSWSRQLAKVKYDPETDTYGFSPKESLTAFLGEGVRCRPDRMELWDGASITSPADTSSSE
jgi:hypothetical protein